MQFSKSHILMGQTELDNVVQRGGSDGGSARLRILYQERSDTGYRYATLEEQGLWHRKYKGTDRCYCDALPLDSLMLG